MSRRVLVVITARPSYSRIKTALVALKARPDVELLIVAGASALVTRYGRIVDQIRADGFEVADEVSSVIDGDGLHESAISTGVLLNGLAASFARLKPDVVVTIADRHETLATAIAASYQHIPLAHVQGGEVTGSIDDKVRNAVTQLADLHLVATEGAFKRLMRRIMHFDPTMREVSLAPGLNVWSQDQIIHVTGCPSIDLAAEAVRLGPLGDPGVVVLQHSVTDAVPHAAEHMRATISALRGLRTTYFWPGEDAGGAAMGKELRMAGLEPIRNLPPIDFLRTLLASDCLVGNSSVGIRECSFLGVPVVNIGTRQANRERAENVVDVPHDPHAIWQAVMSQKAHRFYQPSALYGDGHAGERIAAILAGERWEAAA